MAMVMTTITTVSYGSGYANDNNGEMAVVMTMITTVSYGSGYANGELWQS